MADRGSDYSVAQGAGAAPSGSLRLSQVNPLDPDETTLDRAWQELQERASERPARNGADAARAATTTPRH